MDKVLAIEIHTRESDETFYANYLYDSHHDQYESDGYELTRINCVEPNVNYLSVRRDAMRRAKANNVKLIDHVKLQAGVPFVEELAKMRKGQ